MHSMRIFRADGKSLWHIWLQRKWLDANGLRNGADPPHNEPEFLRRAAAAKAWLG